MRLHQGLQSPEMVAIELLRRSEIHGDAVLHHAVPFEDPVEHRQRPAAVDHEIFRNDLEPVDHRLVLEDMLVMRNSQANTDSVFGEAIEWIGRHYKESRTWGGLESAPRGRVCCWPFVLPSNRRWRSRPCPCKSSCLCIRCRRTSIRRCPCRSSYPCRHAFRVGETGGLTGQRRSDRHIDTAVSVDRSGIDAIHRAAEQACEGCRQNH